MTTARITNIAPAIRRANDPVNCGSLGRASRNSHPKYLAVKRYVFSRTERLILRRPIERGNHRFFRPVTSCSPIAPIIIPEVIGTPGGIGSTIGSENINITSPKERYPKANTIWSIVNVSPCKDRKLDCNSSIASDFRDSFADII